MRADEGNVPSLVGRALLGTISGLGATLAMSAVMLASRRAVGPQPPRQIVDAALKAAGASDPERVQPATNALAVAAHLGYGSMLGALFALSQPRRPSALRGMAFGAAVWAANYAGVLPAVGILPRPSRDRPDRQAGIIASHLVYGATLGALQAGSARSGGR